MYCTFYYVDISAKNVLNILDVLLSYMLNTAFHYFIPHLTAGGAIGSFLHVYQANLKEEFQLWKILYIW